MSRASFDEGCESLRSSRVKERRDGIRDIEVFFNANRLNTRLPEVSDGDYRELFGLLFAHIRSEKQGLSRLSTKAYALAATNLGKSGNAFRLAVEVGTYTLQSKTVREIVSHVTDTLPDRDGKLFEPLADSYIRALSSLFSYPPHAAHLSEAQWLQAAEFCSEALSASIERTADSTTPTSTNSLSQSHQMTTRSTTPASTNGSLARTSFAVAGETASGKMLDNMLFCLNQLLAVPHANVADIGRDTCDAIFRLLETNLPFNRVLAKEYAFSCIKRVLFRSMTERVDLSQYIARNALAHIRRTWQSRPSSATKDEMLSILIVAEPLLENLDKSEDVLFDIEELLGIFEAEHYKRAEKEQLQIDDLVFAPQSRKPLSYAPFALINFKADQHSPDQISRCEQAWAMLRCIAFLSAVQKPNRSNDELDSGPRKRRKVQSGVAEIALGLSASAKLPRLQVLAFALARAPDSLDIVVDSLLPLLSAESGPSVAWALLVLSTAAFYATPGGAVSGGKWTQTWNLASRHIMHPSTVRPACRLMTVLIDRGLLQLDDVLDFADRMLSSLELNAPTAFNDCSLSFMFAVASFKFQVNPITAYETAERMIRWLFLRWRPAQIFLQHRTSSQFSLSQTLDFLSFSLGLKLKVASQDELSVLGPIGRADLWYLEHSGCIEYLSFREGRTAKPDPLPVVPPIDVSGSHLGRLLALVVDPLCSAIKESLPHIDEIRHSNRMLSAENGSAMLGLALVSSLVCEVGKSSQLSELPHLNSQLRQKLSLAIQAQPRESGAISGLVSTLAPLLPAASSVHQESVLVYRCASSLAADFDREFWSGLALSQEPKPLDTEPIEEGIESQNSLRHADPSNRPTDTPSDWIEAASSSGASRIGNTMYVCLASLNSKHQAEASGLVPLEFVDYLVSLEPFNLLAGRSALCGIFDHAKISADGLTKLMEYVGERIIGAYEYERCEVAMGVCLDILIRTVDVWMNTGEEEDIFASLYGWFVKVALAKKISSPHALVCLSLLLQKVMALSPDYAKSSSIVPAQSSLFKILEEGCLIVKFQVGATIADIFDLFVLEEHAGVLESILACLPVEADWTEETAVRMRILTNLGARWVSLLRACVYSVIEAPGLVPAATRYARVCLDRLAGALDLESKQLLKLFVPQIIYTWLETRSLRELPFEAFCYGSLRDLIEDICDEVVAQVIMRGRPSEAEELSQILGQSMETLCEQSFARAAAYAIARDASTPPAADRMAANAASRLSKTLGKERYTSLVRAHFPAILSTLFRIADREDSAAKGFQKYSFYEMSLQAYEEMAAASEKITTSQQPSFRANCLVDEIDYVCNRSKFDARQIWSPALYVYVFRELMNTIHPALGPSHTLAVIKRARILISIAGPAALQDYPLEMALHAFRPLVTDPYCSQDAISVFEYLAKRGYRYLEQKPGFVAALSISTLITLRPFLESRPASTVQESQYLTTMSRGRDFKAWLSSFANDFALACGDTAFGALIELAVSLADPKAKADFLVALLKDQSAKRLIGATYRDLILDTLDADDVSLVELSDGEAVEISSSAWDSFYGKKRGPGLAQFTSRILGQAYAASGAVAPEIYREFSGSPAKSASRYLSTDSRCSILECLCNQLLSADTVDVGYAERALQLICQKAGDESIRDCFAQVPPSIVAALEWDLTVPEMAVSESLSLKAALCVDSDMPKWTRNACRALVWESRNDPFLVELRPLLADARMSSETVFSAVLHLALLNDFEHGQIKREFSEFANTAFRSAAPAPLVKLLLRAIIYLRGQCIPEEQTKSDRSRWLEIDYEVAARAAVRCELFKTALLFLEICVSDKSAGRRRSSKTPVPSYTDVLLPIFQNIGDKDFFYGIRQDPGLSTAMHQLEFESVGFKSLSFRGAYHDSQTRLGRASQESGEELMRLLSGLDLNTISQSMLSGMPNPGSFSSDAMYETARKLESWDLPNPPESASSASVLFRAFRDIQNASTAPTIRASIDSALADSLSHLSSAFMTSGKAHIPLSAMAVLVEAESFLSCRDAARLEDLWRSVQARGAWMPNESFDRIQTIMSCRKTLFSIISKSPNLQNLMEVSDFGARKLEVQTLLSASAHARQHGALRSCLDSASYLASLVGPCAESGLKIEAVAQYEASNVLWEQEQMTTSIRLVEKILEDDLSSQSLPVGRPELLAALGGRVSEARLEKPDEIMDSYLSLAIESLNGVSEGSAAGKVFHEFASFCDMQLQSPDGVEDLKRAQVLRDKKEAEVQDLDRMIRAAVPQSKERDALKAHRSKSKQWLDLDDKEFQRLKASRQALLNQSLENYLLCLHACDDYDKDTLRFSALWLEHSDNDDANNAVSRHIDSVGSCKFANLMNQWTSRLLDSQNKFQTLLSRLVYRVCIDHPFHGMYSIFASSKSKGGKDQMALSRNKAALNVASRLKSCHSGGIDELWVAIHNTNINYVRFAAEKPAGNALKAGQKVPLKQMHYGPKLEQDAAKSRIPPPTMTVDLRADCDYSQVPHIVRYQSEFSVASGISAPKILTAIASNGKRYKQLFKSGNDDLRQDAIMEQVFEQVSSFLKSQRDTRQRNLGIRTYRVLPLTATAGIIEFVSNTIPLHDYLMPAHAKHHPSDLKASACRRQIQEVQAKPKDTRIQVFRQVSEKFRPVLRFFFMEKFESPDDWFAKRLAYTRSTAAISILGHVLGLGDRHGHNILLDEKSGEVVHIDLGIAFEQGRVLPVPEVVPFRLTRDLVDGMGITKTEGVFRRCCEFTLSALRNESYSIMTILDVLRYDPLYSWSLSPLRLKRLQEDQTEDKLDDIALPDKKDEEGEADRALTVVSKKLSKSLSVTATVNELIQQATDEKNLALLFCGWAAYA